MHGNITQPDITYLSKRKWNCWCFTYYLLKLHIT